MQPIINLDVDGTLADFTGHALKLSGSARKPHDVRSANLVETYDLEDPTQFAEAQRIQWLIYRAAFYRDIPLLPGALAFYRRLRAYGSRIQFVTQPTQVAEDSWFDARSNWLAGFLGANRSSLYPVHDKSSVFGHVFLDDRIDILEAWQDMWQGLGTAFLVDAHHNGGVNAGNIERIFITEENAHQTADYVMKVATENANNEHWKHMPPFVPRDFSAADPFVQGFRNLEYVINANPIRGGRR